MRLQTWHSMVIMASLVVIMMVVHATLANQDIQTGNFSNEDIQSATLASEEIQTVTLVSEDITTHVSEDITTLVSEDITTLASEEIETVTLAYSDTQNVTLASEDIQSVIITTNFAMQKKLKDEVKGQISISKLGFVDLILPKNIFSSSHLHRGKDGPHRMTISKYPTHHQFVFRSFLHPWLTWPVPWQIFRVEDRQCWQE